MDDDDELVSILNSSGEECEQGHGSVLATLSDDSLIDYINNLSQDNKKDYTREEYFRDKEVRQREHDEQLRAQYRNVNPPLFEGCTIYINGYTKPGRLQLHEMIVLYGGNFMHYLSSKRRVTHVVATNLPLKKRLEFRDYKVVSPEWITDSVGQKKLLPWQNYAFSWDQDQRSLQFSTAGGFSKTIDCKDPEFLTHFFQNSRLHHLSNWKAELRAQFLKEDFTIPSSNDTLSIFHIDFDCFFASVAALCCDKCPCDINRDPIVVCHGTQSSDIASCNYVARKYGIKNGMWVARAQKLLPPNVELICLPYNFSEIEAKSKIFYRVLKNFEVRFDMILPISIDEAVCVIINHDEMSMSCEQICQELRSEICEATRGCNVSIGCSNTLVLARLNLKLGKPNGYHILNQDELTKDETFWNSFLSKFKIDDLPGVGYSTLSKLTNSQPLDNLLQLKQYTQNSLPLLQNYVGDKLGNKLFLSLQGKDDQESAKIIYEPENYFARKSLSIDINWGIRFHSIHEVDDFIDRCTEYLVKRLKDLNKRTSQIGLKVMRRHKDAPIEPPKFLGMGKCDASSRNTKMGIPTSEFGTIATELKSTFRSLTCPPKELRGIAIQFNKLVDVSPTMNNQQLKLKLPFQKTLNLNTFNDLPNDVKPDIAKELKRRKIILAKKAATTRATTYQERFIEELPTQIRNEVKNDIRITEKIKRTKLDEIREQVKRREEATKNCKNHLLGSDSLFESIRFQKETRFKKICAMILDWVDYTITTEGPHQKDVELFENYLDKLSDSNRVPLILRISKLISTKLNLKSRKFSHVAGFQEWEQVLINIIIPKLNKNKHTFQTVRRLDIDFDI